MAAQTLDQPQVTKAADNTGTLSITDVHEAPKAAVVSDNTNTSGMLLPDSSTRALTDSDVAGLGEKDIMFARNEIYARHGRPFATPEIAAHFESQPWYQKNAAYRDSDLSALEQRNVTFLNLKEFDNNYAAANVGRFTGQSYAGDTTGSVLADSSTRNLTDEDVKALSTGDLSTARNELYARHGRPFTTPEIQAHFDSLPWYQKNADFKDSDLSKQEYRNVLFIRLREMDANL